MKDNLLLLNINKKIYKIAKINYHGDGGFQIFVPYYRDLTRKGFIVKIRHDYRKPEGVVYEQEFLQSFTISRKLKLSHHISGFVQFSGPRVVSGLTEKGKPKGAGVFACSLNNPVEGPICGLGVWGLDFFDDFTKKKQKENLIIFKRNDILHRYKVDYKKQVSYLFEFFCRPISESLNVYINARDEKIYPLYHRSVDSILPLRVLNFDTRRMDYFLSVMCVERNTNYQGEKSGYTLGTSAQMGVNQFDPESYYKGDSLTLFYPLPKIFEGDYPNLDYKKI